MPYTVTAANTRAAMGPSGQVTFIHVPGSGLEPARCQLPRHALEKSAGVWLPKAQIKAIVEQALEQQNPVGAELQGIL